nr:50S ribosomal protein L1, chloroplastic [Tanacetum cinerariifolium]
MATATTSSTLTLSSSIHLHQEPKLSLISSFTFKPNPKNKTFLLQSECFIKKSCFVKNSSFLVSAFAAEAELAEDDVEEEEGGGVATVAPPSPTKLKKGKAALPLKSDRITDGFARAPKTVSVLRNVVCLLQNECNSDWSGSLIEILDYDSISR